MGCIYRNKNRNEEKKTKGVKSRSREDGDKGKV